MKDRIDRFLGILDSPDSLSDEELNDFLGNGEVKEIYSVVSKAADAVADAPAIDIDAEWRRFARRHPDAGSSGIISRMSGFISRNAAAVIVCAAASVAVVAASIGLHVSFLHQNENAAAEPAIEAEATSEGTDYEADGTYPAPQPAATVASGVTFKNQPLDVIIQVIADYYGAQVNFKTDDTRRLRLYFQWNQSLPLEEIISQLDNFEQLDVRLTNNVITIE